MAARARRRRKRRDGEYQAPPRKGQARRPVDADDAGARTPRTRRGGGRRKRPPAPWGSFPLVELSVLLAIILMATGFFTRGQRGVTMLTAGAALGSLAGLELSIREHFAGYRSHTTLLAGATAVAVVVAEIIVLPSAWAKSAGLLVGLVVFAAAFYFLRRAFRRRSGGLSFR